jgi:putative ABC transport system permease protein
MAWQNIRNRPSAFAGAFLALALGVAMIAAAGMVLAAEPTGDRVSRYGSGTVVVTAPSLATATTGRLGGTPGLSPSVLDRLAKLSSVDGIVADRSVEPRILAGRRVVQVADTYLRGHGWSSASFGPYRLATGTPPRADDEVVLDGRLGVPVGAEVTVLTDAGPASYRVTGTTRPVNSAETPAFFTDTRAEQLAAGRVDGAVLLPAKGRARDVAEAVRALDPALTVRTGDTATQPDPLADAYEAPELILALMAAVSTFVSVFVVASTFALTVQRRRRELALLRLAGGTRRQVRRLVRAEALLVGVAGAAVGCALAVPAAHVLAGVFRELEALDLPADFAPSVTPVPFVVATVIGLVVPRLGAWLAARRAGRVTPLDALREAAVAHRSLGLARLVVGLAALGGGVAAAWFAVRAPDQGFDVLVAFGLVVAAAALGPVVVPALCTVFGRRTDVTAEVARATLRVQARRTASVAAPVVVLTGLVGSMLASLFTFEDALAGELRAQTTADLVVLPAATPGLVPEDLTGIDGITPVITTNVYMGERFTARAVPAVNDALRPRVEAGSLNELHGNTVAVTTTVAQARGLQIDDEIPMRLDDGTPVRPRLVAITAGPGGYDLLPAILLPSDLVTGHTAPWSVTHALITLRPNMNRDQVAARLPGAQVVPREQWLDDTITRSAEGGRGVLIGVLAMAVAYTAIAIVNTLVMAVRERVPDLARLRLAGGTRQQALRTLLWEGGYVSAVGVGLGLAVTAVSLTANTIAVRTVIPSATPSAPWWVIGSVAAGAAALVLLASATTGSVALRRRPLDGLAIPE